MLRSRPLAMALSSAAVLRQRSMPMPQMPNIPRKTPPGASMQFQDAVGMEMKLRKQMIEDSKTRFEVVKEESRPERSRVIGIDLGTTNSCLCYIDEATLEPKIIPSPTGSWVFPTAITFDKNHEVRLFGEEARACVRTSASATLCSGKRLIGRRFGELGRVQTDMSKTNILTVTENGEVAIEVAGRTYTVVHIMSMFLRYLKREAERYLGLPVEAAVVSVPAYFTPQQKVATEDAALCAGFDVLEIIDEPSAACLTYTVFNDYLNAGKPIQPPSKKRKNHEKPSAAGTGSQDAAHSSGGGSNSSVADSSSTAPPPAPQKRIVRSLVFDLGGGTLDCAIMERDTRRNTFTLVATHGDPMLGGNDWDTVISAEFARAYEEKWSMPIEEEGGNIGQSTAAYRNLAVEAEKAKIHFTHSTDPYYGYIRSFQFSSVLRDIVPLEATMTHEHYVAITRPLRVRCFECVERLLEHAGLEVEDIDNVLLVGAMTRDPPLRSMLIEYFERDVVPEDKCPADYAVAIGAGIRGGMLQGKFPLLSQNTRFVNGTVQSLQNAGTLRRALARMQMWFRGNLNPNAIGQRWRGRARGLTDEEISLYAKELVEFEAACERRQLLERVENEANMTMKRVMADSNKKQGMQERRLVQLSEQLKFWQYMVHNFHDHEDELERTTRELQEALDELDGLASDSKLVTDQGTIDFKKSFEKMYSNEKEKQERRNTQDRLQGQPETTEADKPTPAPKILRRQAPLPKGSDEGQRLVAAGHPALMHSDVSATEPSRLAFLEAQVEERAWREPPAPPGESGSWDEVRKEVERGVPVGAPLPDEDVMRRMSMEEMLDDLRTRHPIDDPPSEEHARKLELSLDVQTLTIVDGAVDMPAIEALIAAERSRDLQSRVDQEKHIAEERQRISAQSFR